MANGRSSSRRKKPTVEKIVQRRQSVTVEFDDKMTGLLQSLKEDLGEHIPRSIALAGARVLSGRAKELAIPYKGKRKARYSAPGKISGWVIPGELRESIYHAFDDQETAASGKQTYSISWASRKVGYGHLIEFGHEVKNRKKGEIIGKAEPRSFIQKASDKFPEALKAMRERAFEKFAETYIYDETR